MGNPFNSSLNRKIIAMQNYIPGHLCACAFVTRYRPIKIIVMLDGLGILVIFNKWSIFIPEGQGKYEMLRSFTASLLHKHVK